MVTRRQLEEDASKLLSSFNNADYEIPSSLGIVKVILKKLVPFYLLLIGGMLLDPVLYHAEWLDYYTSDLIGGGVISFVLVTVVWIAVFYVNTSMWLCIHQVAKDNSLILNILRQTVKRYLLGIFIINVFIAVFMLFYGAGWVGFLGVPWVVCTIIGAVMFNYSLSHYMTPAVTAALSKIGEMISPSDTSKDVA